MANNDKKNKCKFALQEQREKYHLIIWWFCISLMTNFLALHYHMGWWALLMLPPSVVVLTIGSMTTSGAWNNPPEYYARKRWNQ